MTNVQLVEVVGLEEHVAELGERDPLVASQAGADRLLAQHGPDGYVLADVAEELQDPHVLGPLPVVHQQRWLVTRAKIVVESEERTQLAGNRLDVASQGGPIEEVALG